MLKIFQGLKEMRKQQLGTSAEECPKPRQLWALRLNVWILFEGCSEAPAQLQDRPPGPSGCLAGDKRCAWHPGHSSELHVHRVPRHLEGDGPK